jgi:hypothetical protein
MKRWINRALASVAVSWAKRRLGSTKPVPAVGASLAATPRNRIRARLPPP